MDYILELQQGEARWMRLPLSDSYEYEIIEGCGAHSVREYRQLFYDQGLTVQHLQVQHEMTSFKDIEELKEWIRFEIAPKLDRAGDEEFVESYFQLLKSKGWLNIGDGKIRFPRKQLLVLLYYSAT